MVRPVANRTRVLIVQHPRERKHPFGTARIARLGLANVEVALAGVDDGEIRAVPRALERAAVLYPGASATMLGDANPVSLDTLVVVDGTWPQSRKLLRVSPWLSALPRVAFEPPRPANYRIRRSKRPAFEVSTIEAIAYALQYLEPETPGVGGLVDDFDRVIDHQLTLQGDASEPRFKRA
jgi:DTW domain-containing protein YfiP